MGFFKSFFRAVKQVVKDPVTVATAGFYVYTGQYAKAAAVVALSATSQAVAESQKPAGYTDYASDSVSRTQMIKQPTQPRRFVYGETRVSGLLAHAESTNDDTKLHLVILVATHEIDSFQTIYLNDEALTIDGSGNVTAPTRYANKVRINTHLGTAGQAADTDLVSESEAGWTSSHKLSGIAYIYARLDFDRDAFPNGIPNISAKVRGKKVYDPRTSTTVYSANPALCIRDYLMDTTYGVGAASAEIDDTAFQAAANVCDESVTLAAGGSENRYEFHGVMQTNNAPKKILEEMITSCGGNISYVNGKFTIRVAKYYTPAVTITDDDVIDTVAVQTKRSKRDNYNAVKGIFSPPDTNYVATDYPAITSSTFETEDGNERRFLDFNLPYTISSPMAQRLAKIALYRNRQQIALQMACNLKAFDVQVGDNIYVTLDRFGFSSKVFQVAEWVLTLSNDANEGPVIAVELALRENNSTVYDWDADEAAFTVDNTTLPNPFSLPTPTLTLSDDTQIINQKVTSVLVASVSSTSTYADLFEVQVKKSTDTDYISLGTSSSPVFEYKDTLANTAYDVRARIVSVLGVRSGFATAQRSIAAVTTAVPDVEGFSVNVNGSNADMIWVPIVDDALSHYVIRHSPLTSGATYQNAQTVAKKVSRPANTITLPAQTGTYFIKAVDKLGNESVNADSSIVLVNNIQNLTLSDTVTEHPAFTGTKTDVIILDDKLQLDTSINFDDATGLFDDASGLFDGGDGNVASSGTYEFAGIIDLGNTFTATIDHRMIIDQFPQFTGAITNIGATNVRLQIATTTDDPAVSPTYTAFRDFIVGSYTARAFKFRAILETSDTTQTPRVEELQAFSRFAIRSESDNDIQSGTDAGGKVVTFASPFKTLQAVAISVGDMQSGDFYAITSKTATGFTIIFKDSGSTVVDRLFDYVATGV